MASKFEWDSYPDEPKGEGAGETAAGAALDAASRVYGAVGGVRGIGTAAAAGAGLYGAGRFVRDRMGRKAAPTAPPVAQTAPTQPDASAARISEARAMKMEADARAAAARADLAERRLMPKEPAPADRTTTKRTPKPAARTKRPPAKIPERVVPIKVSGKPEAVRLAKQRGVSKREIASRQKGMAASRTPAGGDDMMEQLARSIESEAGMTKLGVVPGQTLPSGRSMRGAVRSGMRGNALPGALSLLLSLLDAGSIPEQMDEAAAITRPEMDSELARVNPEYARFLAQQRTIY